MYGFDPTLPIPPYTEHMKLFTPESWEKLSTSLARTSETGIPYELELETVMAEPTQLHQIGMNLITNAYHAVEKTGGEIFVQFKETMVDANELKDSSLQLGKYAKLSVSDNGVGISRNVISNIFEPYFTTKDQGKGTTFNVYLPLIKKSAETIANDRVLVLPTGTERLLLVDDEESVVRLEKQMLERLGYKVVAQSSSIDALELFKANPDDYDLVVSDMTMPNMPGDKLAKEVLILRSDMPIIICTGFNERINKDQAESIGVKGFLMKPVVRSEMAQVVIKVLDEVQK